MSHADPGSPGPVSRWSALSGKPGPAEYDNRFRVLFEQGVDVDGEASFCVRLKSPPARVVDVGCGTGRVSVRLAQWGFNCLGIDSDPAMLDRATTAGALDPANTPGTVSWFGDDISSLSDQTTSQCLEADLVVAAGNVMALLAPGTLAAAIVNCRRLLRADGVFLTGFGLDSQHLPPGCPAPDLAEFDQVCERAGLRLAERYSTWQGDDFSRDSGYAVSVLAPARA